MTYAYDSDGNLVNRVTAGVGSETFAYDWAGRLASWTDPSGKVTGYGYDGAGNRVSTGGVVATFDERNRMLADGAGTVIGWSPAGTMSSRTVGAVSTLFAYDGLGRMTSAGSVTYTVDGFDRVVNRGGVSLSYSGAALQPTSDGTGTMSVLPDGTPVGTRSGTTGSVVVANSHGDVIALTNTAGVVSDRWNYDPWGSTLTRTGAADVPVGFQSSFTDLVSGMVDMGARWYAPTQAGFTSEDSWAGDPLQPVTMDRFSYANDNPIGMWDPDGHEPCGNISPGVPPSSQDVAACLKKSPPKGSKPPGTGAKPAPDGYYWAPCVASGTTTSSTPVSMIEKPCLFRVGPDGDLFKLFASAATNVTGFAAGVGKYAAQICSGMRSQIQRAVLFGESLTKDVYQTIGCLANKSDCVAKVLQRSNSLSESALPKLNAEADSFARALAGRNCSGPHMQGQVTCFTALHARGGTTIGDYFLTDRDNLLDPKNGWREYSGTCSTKNILAHEHIHSRPWAAVASLGMPQLAVFSLLYVQEGIDAHRNRFEIDAHLDWGGYNGCKT
jgi:RHS repeat-associated protein